MANQCAYNKAETVFQNCLTVAFSRAASINAEAADIAKHELPGNDSAEFVNEAMNAADAHTFDLVNLLGDNGDYAGLISLIYAQTDKYRAELASRKANDRFHN